MAPEKINRINKFLAWGGGISSAVMLFFTLGGKTVDTVNFVTTTKATNTEFSEFKKVVVQKFDTLFLFMHDLKNDYRKRNEQEYKYHGDINKVLKTCEQRR